MTTITLNEGEQEVVKVIAKLRYTKNRAAGVTNRKVGKQSEAETDLNGAAAEFVVAKALNIYPELSVHVRGGSADLVTRNGLRLDVKTTKYPNGVLLVPPDKERDRVNAFVLVVGSFPTYTIVGWLPAADVFKPETLRDFNGQGMAHVVEQDKLRKWLPAYNYDKLLRDDR